MITLQTVTAFMLGGLFWCGLFAASLELYARWTFGTWDKPAEHVDGDAP